MMITSALGTIWMILKWYRSITNVRRPMSLKSVMVVNEWSIFNLTTLIAIVVQIR